MCILDENVHKFQNVLFSVLFGDVGKRIVVHGLAEIDGIEYLDPIRLIGNITFLISDRSASFQHLSAFDQYCPFRVCNDVGTVHLHEIWFHEESRFTGTRTADDQNVLISGVLRAGRLSHGQAFGLCENDVVVLVFTVHIWLDVLFRTPYRRAVFRSLPELLLVGCTHFHDEFHGNSNCNTNQQIDRVKRRNDMGKRRAEIIQGREYLFRNVLTLSRSERKADDVTGIAENDIGEVIENEFLYFFGIHSQPPNASFPWTSHEPFLSSSVHGQSVLPYP